MVGFIIFCILCFVTWNVYQDMTEQKPRESRLPLQPTEPISTLQDSLTELVFSPTVDTMIFLKALVFIGRSDGALREPQRLEIIAYLREAQPEHNSSPDYFLGEQICDLPRMPSKEYKQYINPLDRKSMLLLLKWSKRVADTLTTPHPFTEYLLEEIETNSMQPKDNEMEKIDEFKAVDELGQVYTVNAFQCAINSRGDNPHNNRPSIKRFKLANGKRLNPTNSVRTEFEILGSMKRITKL